MQRFFSYRNRPVDLGPYPLERLPRQDRMPDLDAAPAMRPLRFADADPATLKPAIGDIMAMLDAIRGGAPNPARAVIPTGPEERAKHLKAAGYYFDAGQVGIAALSPALLLDRPLRNPALDGLAQELETAQPKTLAAGIDVIMADVRDSAAAPPSPVDHHRFALLFLVEHPREPDPEEPGGRWIRGLTTERSALRAAETAVVLANYIRLLGHEARAHSMTSSEVDLHRLALAAGLAELVPGEAGPVLCNPFLGKAFSLAAMTTTLELAADRPLAPRSLLDRLRLAPAWHLGLGGSRPARSARPFGKRPFHKGAYPFERLKRVDTPTTLIDEPRIPRVPKRTDMFARALFGDMGNAMQAAARNGGYLAKNPMGLCVRRVLGALILRQDGETAAAIDASAGDPANNAADVKAALYFLGADAVGLSRCPAFAYYSHDAAGDPIEPYHANAISILIDQGHETMEGASGDDWISGCQSMRAYLRGSILGGVVAAQIRRMGYGARVHSVVDGEVLQPPLLLLSGLGEVSRIGEVILNPFLGPRLKSAVITTDMPFTFDQPIDFGLQNFCASCNKCARECPSGAITAGPKLMFNGYEIWKSDSERCARYRVAQTAGSMCGRCMKTCPWNLEGLFREAPFRFVASHVPRAARHLARLDDRLGKGRINPVKKWWWDLELQPDGGYAPARQTNRRGLQPELDLRYEDQTLAVYPADLAPPPYPFPFPMDREAGIAAYRALLTPEAYRAKLTRGETDGLAHRPRPPAGEQSPVLPVRLAAVEAMTPAITRYAFTTIDRKPLPRFTAGAHIDVVVAPEFFRQYSLAGDPADPGRYQIAVLREDQGKGGSALIHRIFRPGRRVFISRPINHFPLAEDAAFSLLLGGGIGVTPLIAMAHRLHALGRSFALHYAIRSRQSAGFLADLEAVPWKEEVHLYVSDEGGRADLDAVIGDFHPSAHLPDVQLRDVHLYVCGPDRLMQAARETAMRKGWPEAQVHVEYFAAPEQGERVDHPFKLALARTGRTLDVPAGRSATDVLAANGIPVVTKCSDGICGVCACRLLAGEVEHRDFVLGERERQGKIILCSSRAARPGAVIEVDL